MALKSDRVNMSVSLTPADIEAINEISSANDVSASWVVRSAVREYAKKHGVKAPTPPTVLTTMPAKVPLRMQPPPIPITPPPASALPTPTPTPSLMPPAPMTIIPGSPEVQLEREQHKLAQSVAGKPRVPTDKYIQPISPHRPRQLDDHFPAVNAEGKIVFKYREEGLKLINDYWPNLDDESKESLAAFCKKNSGKYETGAELVEAYNNE